MGCDGSLRRPRDVVGCPEIRSLHHLQSISLLSKIDESMKMLGWSAPFILGLVMGNGGGE